MKVLNVDQIRALDAYTITNEPIPSLDLMERAATACADWILEHFPECRHAFVACGAGNNGGDGLVIARLLADSGWNVSVGYATFARQSEDFEVNLARLHQQGKARLIPLGENDPLPQVPAEAIIIDALFGSGLTRNIKAPYSGWAEALNVLPNIVVSVDLPSGLFADKPSDGVAVEAEFTLSFEVPKLAFFIPENEQYTGDWVIIPIGLDQDKLGEMETPWQTFEPLEAGKLLHHRRKFDHKGVYGHALLVNGSYGKAGAAVISARAALRTGAGLVTVHVPRDLVPVLQTAAPEAMIDPDQHDAIFTDVNDVSAYSAIGAGSGLGQNDLTAKGLRKLLMERTAPFVLDADALNLCAAQPELLEAIPPHSILTPHFKEFARLFGESTDHFERLDKLRNAAQERKLIIVLKGAFTAVGTPDGSVYFNMTGNPGMATAGSGDVLTGIITSLLAQHYPPEEAALLGVCLHGLAGDLAAEETGYEALLSGDIIASLGQAYQVLHDMQNGEA